MLRMLLDHVSYMASEYLLDGCETKEREGHKFQKRIIIIFHKRCDERDLEIDRPLSITHGHPERL